jgi:hypothetical protein
MNEFKNCTVAGDGSGPVPVKNLFLDNHHIESMTGLSRVYHQPVKHGKPVIVPDRPWEMGSPRTRYNSGSVDVRLSSPVWDGERGVWRMWYTGGIGGLPLYAESTDGVRWEKPELGLVEWEGSRRNNIYKLHEDGKIHYFKDNGPSIVRDDGDPDPSRRYKGVIPPDLTRIVSPDGLTWRRLEGSIPADDTFFLGYDKRNRQFLLTVKLNITKPRQGVSDYPLPSDYLVGRTAWLYSSRDFERWEGPQLLLYPNPQGKRVAAAYMARLKSEPLRRQPLVVDPEGINKLADLAGGDDGRGDVFQLLKHQSAMSEGNGYKADIYNMPLCEYEGMYLGFPTRMISTGPYQWSWDQGNWQEKGSNADGLQYVFLASSRDLRSWSQQEETPFIDTSPTTDEDVFDNGMVMGTAPVRHGDELWFYYWGTRFTHHQHHELPSEIYQRGGITPDMRQSLPVGGIFLAKLRLDGFASLRGAATAGEVVTKSLPVNGKSLYVNAAAQAGTLKAELLDAATGEVIPGYSLTDSVALKGDSVCAKLQWRSMADLSWLAGKSVKIRFSAQNADIYSFWFGQ